MIASCIRTPAREPLVILRSSYLRLCDGDHCAAVLLNEFVYRTDGQLAATNERQWIQATIKQLSDAMMGLYSERKIRDALTLLCDRGLLKRQEQAGDKSGAYYTLRTNSLNKALDELDTPAETQGDPGKKDRGARQKSQGSAQNTLSYTRARSEKKEEVREKEEVAEASVCSRTGSSTAQLRAPAAADPWKLAADAVRRYFPALGASAWKKCQQRAEERRHSAEAIAAAVQRFGQEALFGASNPVVFVLKICDRLDTEQAHEEERQLAPRAVGKAKVFAGHACLSCSLDLWWSDGGIGASCFECDPPQWSDELMAQGFKLADAAHQRRTERESQREAQNVEYEQQLEADAIAAGLKPAAQALPRWCAAQLGAPPADLAIPATEVGAGP